LEFAASGPFGLTAGEITQLSSTSEVFIPPRSRDFMKFSFDFPEPVVALVSIDSVSSSSQLKTPTVSIAS
jgi:hypothetical protein